MGNDVIVGLGGNDVIRGQDGDDIICGGPGFDEIQAGDGDDRAYGGRGNDKLYGDLGNDRLWGGTGWDKLFGGSGDDTIFGGKGNDMLQGDEGNDQLDGQIGDDALDGVPDDDGGSSFSDIAVQLDGTVYNQGDDVGITGIIDGGQEGESIDITIREPGGGSESADIEIGSDDGEFDVVYSLANNADDGLYQIEVAFGNEDSVFTYFIVDEEDDAVTVVTDEDTYEQGDTVLDQEQEDIDGSDEFSLDFDIDNDEDVVGRYAIIVVYNDSDGGFAIFEVTGDRGGSAHNILLDLSALDVNYEPGDDVTIRGSVEDIDSVEDSVTIIATDPGGDSNEYDAPLDDDEFELNFELENTVDDGIYIIDVEYLGESVFTYLLIDEQDDEIQVETGSDLYEPNDTIEIFGQVQDPSVGLENVEITVLDPNGERVVDEESTDINNDGEFEFDEFEITDSDTAFGRYAVTVVYDNQDKGYAIFGVVEDVGGRSSITASLSKNSYRPGDTVVVAGEIEEVEPGDDVFIEVEDPDGANIYEDAVAPETDGSFEFAFTLEDDALTGWYIVTLTYIQEGNEKVLTFDVETNPGVPSTSFETEKPINISDNPSHSKYPDILVLNNHVYVTWMDGNDAISVYDIYFKASHDYGATFGPAIKLSGGGFNLLPILAAFGSDVYVTWTHEGNGDFGAKFKASHDYGNSFEPKIDFGSDTWYARADIAAYDNNVYLVFEHPADPGTEMIFLPSHDRGLTFGEPFVYRKGVCVAGEPHVAAWENHVYIVGLDPCKNHSDLLFAASEDNGTSFFKPQFLGDGSQQIKLVANGKFVYLLWNENTSDVRFRVSDDYGRTFGPSKDLEGNLDISNPTPQIAISGISDVYVVWASNLFSNSNGNSTNSDDDDNDIKTHLFFTASHDGGQTFGSLKRFDTSNDYSVNPAIAAAGSNVFVAWQNVSAFWTPSGSEILFKRSDDKGGSFGETLVIDNDTGDSLGFVRPDLAVAENTAYISWWRGETLDDAPDIYLQRGNVIPID